MIDIRIFLPTELDKIRMFLSLCVFVIKFGLSAALRTPEGYKSRNPFCGGLAVSAQVVKGGPRHGLSVCI